MGMAEYINKEQFLSSMGLVGDETKYGNRDSEHQSRSYGTWMGYEILDSIDDCVEEDAVRVVRCNDCKYYRTSGCAIDTHAFDVVEEGFCSYGERKEQK